MLRKAHYLLPFPETPFFCERAPKGPVHVDYSFHQGRSFYPVAGVPIHNFHLDIKLI